MVRLPKTGGLRAKLYFVLRSNFSQASVIEEAQDDTVRFHSFVCVKTIPSDGVKELVSEFA